MTSCRRGSALEPAERRTLRSVKDATAMRAPLAIIPGELEYFTELPRMLENAGFAVRQADGPDALTSLIGDADVMLASAFLGVNREQLTAAARLRGVISLIIGVDNVDVQACTDLGIIVGNGAVPQNPIGTAEGAVLLIVALLKGLKLKENAVRSGGYRPSGDASNLVWRRTVGIIGVGLIGPLRDARTTRSVGR